MLDLSCYSAFKNTVACICYVLVFVIVGAHFLLGFFIYFPELALNLAGEVPKRHGASVPRCNSFHWADPTYFKVEGGLSEADRKLFVESKQQGGILLDYRCYDKMCGLALPTDYGQHGQWQAIMPLPDVNATSTHQLPKSCQLSGSLGSMLLPKDAEHCMMFCRNYVGTGMRSLATLLCPISAGDLSSIYATCLKVEMHNAFQSYILGVVVCILCILAAWLQTWRVQTAYLPVSCSELVIGCCDLDEPPSQIRRKLAIIACPCLATPFLTMASVMSYLYSGDFWFLVVSLIPSASGMDPVCLVAVAAMRRCWISCTLTRELLLEASVRGKISGVLLGCCAVMSLAASPPAFVMTSVGVTRALVAIVSLGVCLPSAFEAQHLLADLDPDENTTSLMQEPSGLFVIKGYCQGLLVSLVVIICAVSVARMSLSEDIGMHRLCFLPLFVLLSLAFSHQKPGCSGQTEHSSRISAS